MTDKEIIQGLIGRDNCVTREFFYEKCRPLLSAIMRCVFNHRVEYDEMVSELYDYLMQDDCSKLRQFQYRSSIYQWMKVVATRFFIRKRVELIEHPSNEPLYEVDRSTAPVDTSGTLAMKLDVAMLLAIMQNRRYADVIRHLILNEEAPEEYAASIGVSVDNLYNIKRRAMASLTRTAIMFYSNER